MHDDLVTSYDAFLVACYSSHPLVGWLRKRPEVVKGRKHVLGIFEASVFASLDMIEGGESYGIVSTGTVWETLLSQGIRRITVEEKDEEIKRRFAGVETTGLNATELHDAPSDEVERRMKEAVKRLVTRGKVGAVCLGCAGMTGLDEIVRQALREDMGEAGDMVKVVDGVLEGVRLLSALCTFNHVR